LKLSLELAEAVADVARLGRKPLDLACIQFGWFASSALSDPSRDREIKRFSVGNGDYL